MAPTGTLDNTTATEIGGNSADDVGRVSLYIAIAALAISSLLASMQLLFAYVTASVGRNKTNTAAVGAWHRYTRLSMKEAFKGKLHVSYGVMDLSQQSLFQDLRKQEKARHHDLEQLKDYLLQARLSRSRTKDGYKLASEEMCLLRRGVAEDVEVPLSELSRSQRAALRRLQVSQNRHNAQIKFSHASYVMLAHHLNYDFDTFRPTRYEDADRIPVGCCAPLNTIRMSDAINFGYLLDMNLQVANPSTGEILMTGKQCKIYSEHLPNIGLVCRYDVKAHNFYPTIRSLVAREPDMLVRTAGGAVGYLDTVTTLSLLGYNSMGYILDVYLGKAVGDSWQGIESKLDAKLVRGDEDGRWNNRWGRPETILTAAHLAVISSPAIAKAFPHKELIPWGEREIKFSEATRHASAALSQESYALLHPSEEFIPTIFGKYYVNSSSYKVVDNFGCEYGGFRGYLSTNLAKFTKFVAECWPWSSTPEYRERPPVPILLELINPLQNGEPLTAWAASYATRQCSGENWTMTARAALWIQITMFDTWIGCMIDRLMGATALREVPIPAEIDEANACADAAAQIPQTDACNPVRSRWLKLYLCRLAEGRSGRGDSFMSRNPPEILSERWLEMELGSPSEWLVLDAVITMRAATLYAMLMELDDSSVLLELKENDPLLYMT